MFENAAFGTTSLSSAKLSRQAGVIGVLRLGRLFFFTRLAVRTVRANLRRLDMPATCSAQVLCPSCIYYYKFVFTTIRESTLHVPSSYTIIHCEWPASIINPVVVHLAVGNFTNTCVAVLQHILWCDPSCVRVCSPLATSWCWRLIAPCPSQNRGHSQVSPRRHLSSFRRCPLSPMAIFSIGKMYVIIFIVIGIL